MVCKLVDIYFNGFAISSSYPSSFILIKDLIDIFEISVIRNVNIRFISLGIFPSFFNGDDVLWVSLGFAIAVSYKKQAEK